MPIDQTALLTRGVETIMPDLDSLRARMQQGPVRVYLGIDPTGNNLHLGHLVVLRKLQQFADAGNEVILLIGNGTVRIGDPTGRDATRPQLTDEQIMENFSTWKEQASVALDFNTISLRKNGDWLDALNFSDLVKLLSRMSVQQLLERDMFQERIKAGLPVLTHELIYPLLQGYDSVVMDVDLEIGGNDQLFNMMVGRDLQRQINNKEKWVLTVPLLSGSDGRKMGKSLGNHIPLQLEAGEMYRRLMTVADEVMFKYIELLTTWTQDDIKRAQKEIDDGESPMIIKKRMAFDITAMVHGEEKAQHASDEFVRLVQEKEIPDQREILKVGKDESWIDVLSGIASVESRSNARRLIEQGAVKFNGNKITPEDEKPKSAGLLQIGAKRYFDLEMT